MSKSDIREIQEALAEPFDPKEVKWKPQIVKDNRCLAIAYISARVVMERLDEVVGADHWQDQYQFLDGPNAGSVLCSLKVLFGDQWVVKEDVGGQSQQPDDGDRTKAAVSDSLKRAAIKWGIGRYLYRLDSSWVDYDPKAKRVVKPPTLPAWAMPRPAQHPGCITKSQADELRVLRQASHVDARTFFQHFGINALEQLPAARLEEAKGLLKLQGA